MQQFPYLTFDPISAQALSGVFLAEQIRQQQLAAALESRLSDSSKASGSSAAELMQAAMSKLGGGIGGGIGGIGSTVDTSKLLAIAAAAAAAASSSQQQMPEASSSSRRRGRKNGSSRKVVPKKNTVASMLATGRWTGHAAGGAAQLTPEELEMAERATAYPELTIEPIFRNLKPDR